MKKILLTIALATSSLAASADYRPSTHYHLSNGTAVVSNTIRPTTVTTFETDARGRRIRVETTTTCVSSRVNRRNNHLRCLDTDITVQRRVVRGPDAGDRPPMIEPVVYRTIERDDDGRRFIVTTTYTCIDARWNPTRTAAVCFEWRREVTREPVRRRPRAPGFDLNGDGRTDPWERLLYRGFREALDD